MREFKRRIGDPVPILVAGTPFSAQALTARLLSCVVATATEREGAAPDEVVLTYPANWGGYKRELLDQVIAMADCPRPLTCTEPEAAAIQYAARAHLAEDAKVAVYDLGGGTFDVCVLEKQRPVSASSAPRGRRTPRRHRLRRGGVPARRCAASAEHSLGSTSTTPRSPPR